MKIAGFAFPLIIAVLFFSVPLLGQQSDASSIWITVYGVQGAYETMKFGNRIGNTWGLDTAASYPPEYKELAPPVPMGKSAVPGFQSVWGATRAGQFGTFYGLYKYDFRDYSSDTQQDTFRINFCQCDIDTATITFRWPDSAYLSLHCDGLKLRYSQLVDGSLFFVTVDMFKQNSLLIPMAGVRGVGFVRIYKTGVHLIETGAEESDIPVVPTLLQNYPNPFNPRTEIRYDVSSRQVVRLIIYDMLGRQIATLVDGIQDPGFKSVTWDAAAVPSGVYFCRLQAGEFIEVRKLILVK